MQWVVLSLKLMVFVVEAKFEFRHGVSDCRGNVGDEWEGICLVDPGWVGVGGRRGMAWLARYSTIKQMD